MSRRRVRDIVNDLYVSYAQYTPPTSTEPVGSRRELVAHCVHTADADATKQFRRVGVGGVYWALFRTHRYPCDPAVRI